jgi:hypothetical protein
MRNGKHQYKTNPTINLLICSERIYIDYWTGKKRLNYTGFIFNTRTRVWTTYPFPGVEQRVTAAFVGRTINQHGKPSLGFRSDKRGVV